MSSGIAYEAPARAAIEWESEEVDAPAWEPLLVKGGRNSAREADLELHAQFDMLARELLADAAGVSVPRRLLSHPAYTGILSLGDDAVPLLLERLRRPGGRPVWLTLLGSITGFQPGAGMDTVEDAAAEWIRWGRRHLRSV